MAFKRQELLFREVEREDLALLRDLRNDPESWPGWRDPRSVQTMEEQEMWYQTLDREKQAFVVEDESVALRYIDGDKTDWRVGLLRFTIDPLTRTGAMVGCDVFEWARGKGYGKRIMRAGAEYLILDLGMHRVTSQAMPSNPAAQKMILAAGFRHEGTWKDYLWRDGKWNDFEQYAILEGEL